MSGKAKLLGLVFSALLLAGVGASSAAEGGMSKKDLEILGRAIGFMKDGPSGDVTTAVVFVPGNSASEAERDAIMGVVGSGLKVGNITLKAKASSVADAAASGARVWLVTGAAAAKMGQAGTAAKAITASADKACVEAGNCVLGIETGTKVQIYVSRKAAEASSVAFESAFLLMVKEL